ncbi:MAG: RHS repeat-associated core domain-containing protein [Muribaculum sp.]|nr:RHS repeat-associated core domain-containing protein [Muribaculum sp.]
MDSNLFPDTYGTNGGITVVDPGIGGSQDLKQTEYDVERFYIGGDAYTAPAVMVKSTRGKGSMKLYFIVRDHVGSIVALVDTTGGKVEQELSYDAWGRLRDPDTYEVYASGKEPALILGRGYGSHDYLRNYGLVNMNARLYDPVLGRFLSPDPYVQDPTLPQNFNRYSYCLNNPLCYIDPDGKIAWFVPVIIGATIGAYSGGVISNKGEFNPLKWDYASVKTWSGIIGGALVGGVSGYVGNIVASSEIPFANTLSICCSSLINSMGNNIYTGGQTPLSISFGIFSINLEAGNVGFLGKGGNSIFETLSYVFGGFANLADVFSAVKGGGKNIAVNSSKTKGGEEWWGHRSISTNTGESIVSVGPLDKIEVTKSMKETYLNSIVAADKDWDTHFFDSGTWKVELNNVSINALNNYVSKINRWDLLWNSCVGHTTRALWSTGIPTLYIFHPHMLNAQLLIRQIGIYSSPYMYNLNGW